MPLNEIERLTLAAKAGMETVGARFGHGRVGRRREHGLKRMGDERGRG